MKTREFSLNRAFPSLLLYFFFKGTMKIRNTASNTRPSVLGNYEKWNQSVSCKKYPESAKLNPFHPVDKTNISGNNVDPDDTATGPIHHDLHLFFFH